MTGRGTDLYMRRFQALHATFEKHLNSKRVLGVVCFVILAVVAVRFYHMSVTGYMLPDEAYYYERIVLQRKPIQNREVFTGIYALFFANVRNISSLMLVGAIYASIWGVGTAALAYKISRRLEIPDEQQSLLLASLLFFPVYTIMIPLMLTETMGLFFAMIGIYFALRFHQRGSWTDSLVASLAFVAAYKVREVYLLFALANFVGVLMSRKRNMRSSLAYLIPLALVLPVPVKAWPLEFAGPVYAFLPELAQRAYAFLANPQLAPTTTSPTATAVATTTTVPAPIGNDYYPPVTLAPPASLGSFLYAFAIGLAFGYNPVFAVLALVSVFLAFRAAWRKRTVVTGFPLWNALAGLGSYTAALLFVTYPAGGFIPVWTSAAIRASHASLPAAFAFSKSYSKIGSRNVIAILLVLLIAGSTQLPVLSGAIQTNLTRAGETVDRFSLDYRAPYYRLYELAEDSGRTVVFALNTRGVRTYFSMLADAMVEYVPDDESQFKALLSEGWDTIYLFDSYYTMADPSSLKLYPPYYREILISRTYEGYTIQTLWIDAESYAFKMIPTASAES